jgi:acyl carrier protein
VTQQDTDREAALRQRLARLSPERRAAAEQLLAGATRAPGGEPPLVPRPAPDQPAPLSAGQEQMWLMDLLTGVPGSLIDHVAVRLTGPFDHAAFARALAQVTDRHEILRTRIVRVDGSPMQVPVAEPVLDLAVRDLTGQDLAACLAQAGADSTAPFDLAIGPLLRTRVYRLGPTDHVLLIALHHMITDASSEAALLAELSQLYRAELGQGGDPLPRPAIQYADYARWQRELLRGERLERLLDYWSERLAGVPWTLPLPLDRPRTVPRGGAYVDVPAPAALVDRVTALARDLRTTLFVVLLAGLRVLLWRQTGQRALIVGTPISARTRAETEGVLGYFLNMLALPGAVDPDAPVRDAIGAEHAATMSAYAHADLPFERLVAHLRPAREPGSTPLVQVLFSADSEVDLPADFAGLACTQLALTGGIAQYDLMVKAVRAGDGFVARWDYDDAIHDRDRIAALGGEFWELVSAMVEDPGRPVRDLPGRTPPPAAPTPVVVTWAGTADEDPPRGFMQETVAELWAELLGVSPGANDVLFDIGGHSLTTALLAFRLTERFGVSVPVPALFEHQTVATQAAYLEELLLARADVLPADALDRLVPAPPPPIKE